MRSDIVARGEGTEAIDAALADILRDLGRHTLTLDRDARTREVDDDSTEHRTDTTSARDAGFTDEVEARTLEEVDDSWYTDEVAAHRGRRLFSPHEIESGVDDVPDSEHLPELDDTDGIELDQPIPVAFFVEDAGERLAEVHAGARLGELVGLLPPLGDEPEADELSIEASRIQWACSDLDRRLEGLDEKTCTAVCAWLAARNRDLIGRLDVDVGPRTALERLGRWHRAHGLPMVAGLSQPPTPEHSSWSLDARAWHKVLLDLTNGKP